jgi:hypothetical protein
MSPGDKRLERFRSTKTVVGAALSKLQGNQKGQHIEPPDYSISENALFTTDDV